MLDRKEPMRHGDEDHPRHAQELRPVKDALSQLQMAFVQASQQGEAAPQPEETGDRRQETGEAASGANDEAQRAKARSKIWTPPGS